MSGLQGIERLCRRGLVRIIGVLLPLVVVFGVAELLLRFGGYGYSPGFFKEVDCEGEKFLVENPYFGWRFMPPAMARAPLSFRFREQKPSNCFRIFVFGESAAMGDPDPAFGFSRILRVLLQSKYPEVNFEVINTAFPAINSHVIREIASDCAGRGGDVWIIYMGNNEVLGPYGATTAFGSSAPPLLAVRLVSALTRVRFGQCLCEFARQLRGRRGSGSLEMAEMLLSRPVKQNDQVLERIYWNFHQNLRSIVEMGIRARARIVINTLVSNLKDCAPFMEGDSPIAVGEEKERWQREFLDGVRLLERGLPQEALIRFENAARLSTNHAGLQFQLGRLALALGRTNIAKVHFELARDMDAFRARADARINNIIRSVALEYVRGGVRLVDAEQAFAMASAGGITGAELMCDHVHFRFSGNYLLARLEAEAISSFIGAEAGAAGRWLDEESCARRLGFIEWSRYRFAIALRRQLSGELFRRQANNRELDARLREEIRSLSWANQVGAAERQISGYRAAIAGNPEDWVLHDLLGSYLLAQSDCEGAIGAWSNAVKLVPHAFTVRYKLGLALIRSGRAAEALQHLLVARELRPMLPEVHAAIGTAYSYLTNHKDADRSFACAVALDPGNEHARVAWSESLLARGKVEEACSQLREVLVRNTNSVQAHVRLGLFYAGRNEAEKATHHFREVLRIDPRNETALLYLSGSNVLR
ncbi:MAG: tetratricopeptide repeat protein, partial [Verrucomicrobiae bacterium]|nr:tetratricopeptide repeat protein [Verrucomicrobiae bacterium]